MKLKVFTTSSSANTTTNNEADSQSRKAVTIQISLAMLANLSVLSPGMGLGFPAVTSEILLRDSKIILTPEQVSWFASITPFICPLGGPLSSYCVTKYGRKGTLIIINIISITYWIITAFSSQNNAEILFIQLMIARVLTGFTIGMITAPAVMYSTEICYPKLRGRLAVLSTPFFISIGALLIYFLGYVTGVRKIVNLNILKQFSFHYSG
jgi:MFS family permease